VTIAGLHLTRPTPALPPADAALTDAVRRPLGGCLVGEALAVLCRALALDIALTNPRHEQDAILALAQHRIAAELRAQQTARAGLAIPAEAP
jgi:hypothetical protein